MSANKTSFFSQVTNDPTFSTYVEDEYDIETIEDESQSDDVDSGYFSDGELSSSQEVEVDDNFFFDHILDDDSHEELKSGVDAPPKLSSATPEEAAVKDDSHEENKSGIDDPPINLPEFSFATPEKTAVDALSFMHKTSIESLGSSTESLPNNNTSSPGWEFVDNAIELPNSARLHQLSIDEAWKVVQEKKLMSNERYKILMCRLQCDHCRMQGTMGVPIGDGQYDHDCRSTERWYDTQLITGFCALLEHDAHMKINLSPPPCNDQKVMMVYCPYPNSQIKNVLFIRENVTHLVSVVLNNSHFAVLYYDVKGKIVSVFDGLNMKITHWQQHIIHTLQEYGIEGIDTVTKCAYRVEKLMNQDGIDIKKMFVNIWFGNSDAPWIVTNERQYRQKDGYNCGPIAMLKLLEIYGYIKQGSIDAIGDTPAGYRGVAMNFFNLLKDKYYSSLLFEMRQDVVSGEIELHPVVELNKQEEQPSEQSTFPEDKGHFEVPESPESTPAEVRAQAMEMKNKRQEENAIKAMKLCGTVAVADGVAVGAVVSLKVDYRTHSHAHGLMGVVYAVKEETGGILVCCEHGVITHSGSKGDYWVPYDKYRVVAKKDEEIPISNELTMVRDIVLDGKYNAGAQKRISYAKLHDIMIQSTSPVKRGKGCTCRRGCKKSCGCKKNGYKCHSGCFCNGNCDGEI